MQAQTKERPTLGPIYENPQQNGVAAMQKKMKQVAPPPPKATKIMSCGSSSSSFGVKSSDSSPTSTPSSISSTNSGVLPKKKPAPKRPPSEESMDGDYRTVSLKRQQNAPLGFSIRGGREHGTGVFVSIVDANSEAQAVGLKPGDQILKINGFPVDQFVHEEVCMMLKSNQSITLKLAETGLLPTKDKGDVVLKPVSEVGDVKKKVAPPPPPPMEMYEPPAFERSGTMVPPPPAPPAPPHNTMRPIAPPMPTHMFVSELHSVAQQLRKLQITKDIAMENPLLKQVAINQQQHDRLMSEFKDAHRKMFGAGGRFPDEFSDTEKTLERKAERTEVLCVKNTPDKTTAISPTNLRNLSSSLLSIKTDSGRGSSSSSSASGSPTSSIINVRHENGTTELKPATQSEDVSVAKTFGVQLKNNLRRESSNMELRSIRAEDKQPLRREQSNLELGSGGGHVILRRENASPVNRNVNNRRDSAPAMTIQEQEENKTNVVCVKNVENSRARSNSVTPLIQSSPFGAALKKTEVGSIEKQFVVQDKNVRRDNASYIIPKKDFEKPEFKREYSNVDIRQMGQGFEAIPEDHFVNRTGRTEVIFIRNSRENGRDIETSSVISSDEGSTYSGSSGCGELVGRLRRQFEDPGSDSDASSGKLSVFPKKNVPLPLTNNSGKITVSINMAPLPKNAC